MKSLDKSTHAATRSVELAMRQYEKGLITYQPLLDSERALVQQQDALAESRAGRNEPCRRLQGTWRWWQARLPSNQPQPEAVPAPAGEPLPSP